MTFRRSRSKTAAKPAAIVPMNSSCCILSPLYYSNGIRAHFQTGPTHACPLIRFKYGCPQHFAPQHLQLRTIRKQPLNQLLALVTSARVVFVILLYDDLGMKELYPQVNGIREPCPTGLFLRRESIRFERKTSFAGKLGKNRFPQLRNFSPRYRLRRISCKLLLPFFIGLIQIFFRQKTDILFFPSPGEGR